MKFEQHIVLLVGGVGGAKIAYGLAEILRPSSLSIIVNTADDFQLHGLHISPDIDTVMYTLAGLANPETGWGITGDTYIARDALSRLGQPDWFHAGRSRHSDPAHPHCHAARRSLAEQSNGFSM